MQNAALLALAFGTGLLVPVQLALNAQLGAALRSPFLGAFFVFVAGALAMALACAALRTGLPSAAALKAVPPAAWAGGLVAALYILAVVVLVPRVGVATTAVLIIAGQILGAALLDHLGAFGGPRIPIDLARAAGIAAVLAGAALVRFG
jgi:transporter family-2 protein